MHVIVTNYRNWQREKLRLDRENREFENTIEWVPCIFHCLALGLILSAQMFALGVQGVAGVCAGSMRLFGYQYGGMGNTKVLRWGYCPTQSPNASGFTLQWNNGFSFSVVILLS